MKRAYKITFAIVLAVIIFVTYCAAFGLAGTGITGVNDIRLGIDIKGGVNAVFAPADLDRAPTSAELESARAVIETRLDNENILDREVTVDQENGQILVSFPWKSSETDFNPEEAIAELGEMAQLTFRDSSGNILMTGDAIESAYATTISSSTTPVVMMEFTAEGQKEFYEATEACVGKSLYIYMDDDLISYPTVNSAIDSDTAYIEGLPSLESARTLANKINAGALPFSITCTSQSTISPSLGQGALNVMLMAAYIAFALIIIFMIVRYRFVGLIIDLTLVFEVAGLILCMSIPQITLTLPGIAGIVLTVGMSVDAGIITGSRIADELRLGYEPDRAVRVGFQHALSAVIDGNLTSLIVAVILIIMGTGTILSFGYTLFFGIILNLFCVVLGSRLMLPSLLRFKCFQKRWLYSKGKDRKILKYYEHRKVFLCIVLAVLIIGGIFIGIKGVSLDTSFTGGAVLRYSYEGELDESTIEQIAESTIDRPATIQFTSDIATGEQKLQITFAGNESLTTDDQAALKEALTSAYPDSNIELSESNIVEPYIGARTLRNSALAIVIAAALILLYVAIRFSVISGLRAGVTALVALLFDITVVFLTFVIFGIALNEMYVAVTLTILGYSINGTIINYDRVRENRKLFNNSSLGDLINMSISQCLNRSLWSSATTLATTVIMYIFATIYGLSAIQEFSLPMSVGIISGFFSSTCIAGPLWVTWQYAVDRRKQKRKAR